MKKYITILFGLIVLQSCDSGSCEKHAEMYRPIEFEMKVQKIPRDGTPYIRLEGRNRQGKDVSWEDFSRWLISIDKIEVGDSIFKPKGKAYLLLKKPMDTTYTKYYYECDYKKYDQYK